jgi:hypothetical protein
MAETETPNPQEPQQEGQQAQDPQNPPEGAQGAGTEQDEALETSDVTALRREAAGRRRELRTVQAERDQLRSREDKRDRAEAERIARARMADASDLWSLEGVALENFRDEDGELVGELVAQAVSDALARKPHWKRQEPSAQPNLHQGARQPDVPAPSFGAALKADRGR